MHSKHYPNNYFAIGLMSGTSLDGLDISYSHFYVKNNKWKFDLLKSKSVTYSNSLKEKLKSSVTLSGIELTILDKELGVYFADEVEKFIISEKIKKVDVIGSHGHTVFHQPEKGITLQIGDPLAINLKTGKTVVADFRSQDVALGGQGAPLVPIGDKLLFSDYHYRLNLGGFANISYEENGKTVAFDICAVNTILNFFSNKLNKDYDDKGLIAKSGIIIPELLDELNNIKFYKQKAPKSLSVEWNEKTIHPILKKYSEENTNDLMRTYVQHIALQIGKTLFIKNKKALFSGGGAFNDFLIQQIKENTSTKIAIENNKITNFKEAIIFSFLAVLKLRNETNCLSEVTGAEKDHSSGVIYSNN